MITVALLMVWQVILLVGLGHWVLHKGLGLRNQVLEITTLISLGIAGVLGNTYSLFFPMNAVAKTGFALLCLSAYFDKSCRLQFKEYIDRIIESDRIDKTVFVLLITLATLLAAGPIIRDDSESYHLQSILWLNEYGTVPGLANLHSRLGFNSSWLQTISLLTPLSTQNFYTTPNTLLSILVASAVLIPHKRGSIEQNSIEKLSRIATLFLMLSIWYYWRGNIQSCNYDYYFTATIILFYFQLNAADTNKKYKFFVLALLPPILCSIRLIYFPSLLITAYILLRWHKEKRFKSIAYTIAVTTVALGAHVYRSYVLSGYPLYPSSLFTFSIPYWQVPKEQLTHLLEYIRNYSISRELGFVSQLMSWASYLFHYEKLVVGLGGLGLLVAGFQQYVVKKETDKKRLNFTNVLAMYISVQILLWFYVSPEPRFIAGIFFIGQTMLLRSIFQKLINNEKITGTLHRSISILFCVFLAILILMKLTKEKEDYMNIYWPKLIPKPETRNFIWERTMVRIPEKINDNWNNRCYLTPLPCVYDSLPGIKMKSSNLADGFYTEQYKRRKLP